MVEGSARDALKAQLKESPGFRSELKDRIKTALLGKVPASTPISYNFDSYMLQVGFLGRTGSIADGEIMMATRDIEPGQLRVLEVDERLVLPTNTLIRVLVTASDVLHSFAVPSLGMKIDAVPGRLNQVWLNINRPGVFYGQCSELCGANHSFMPIVVEAITPRQWLTDYVKKVQEDM